MAASTGSDVAGPSHTPSSTITDRTPAPNKVFTPNNGPMTSQRNQEEGHIEANHRQPDRPLPKIKGHDGQSTEPPAASLFGMRNQTGGPGPSGRPPGQFLGAPMGSAANLSSPKFPSPGKLLPQHRTDKEGEGGMNSTRLWSPGLRSKRLGESHSSPSPVRPPGGPL